jgi:hypothetical protein
MAKDSRIDKAQDRVLAETCMEFVTDVYAAPDYVQVVGNAGGDCVCYRVYNDGTIVEK